jgi:curved DNA-binding protein CbpA
MEVRGFVNYYEVLELAPSASTKAVERRFRHLARLYHPDNHATGDRSRFDAILEAHNTLKDAGKRAKYHADHQPHLPPFSPSAEEEGEPVAAEEDADDGEAFFDGLGIDKDLSVQNNLLILLYLRRRRNVREPGIGNAELERLSGCPAEHLDFHIWYLKAKGWIATGDDGLLQITIDGVDRAALIYKENAKKLITDQS